MTTKNNQTAYTPVTSRDVAYTASVGTAAAAIGSYISVVRLLATTGCYVTFNGSTPAAGSAMKLAAGIPEYFTVGGGETIKVVQETTGGTLTITEMDQ
jgi:hypothetical protein